MLLWSVSCETHEQIIDDLYFKLRSLHLHVQCIRDSSFVERSLYSLRAKNGYLDIRERIDQPPFP